MGALFAVVAGVALALKGEEQTGDKMELSQKLRAALLEQLNDNSTESALPEQLENATEPEEGFLSPPEMIRTEDLPPIEMPGIFPDGKEPEDVNGTDPAIIGPIVPGDGDLGNGTEPVDIDPEIPDDHIPEGEDGTLPPEVGEDDQIIITRAPGGGP